jgi:molybdopterin-binding protein
VTLDAICPGDIGYGLHPTLETCYMRLSARNQLPGRVATIRLGTVMAEVSIDIGDHTLVAAITRGSAEALGLREGDRVTAIVKSTEIIVGKD